MHAITKSASCLLYTVKSSVSLKERPASDTLLFCSMNKMDVITETLQLYFPHLLIKFQLCWTCFIFMLIWPHT